MSIHAHLYVRAAVRTEFEGNRRRPRPGDLVKAKPGQASIEKDQSVYAVSLLGVCLRRYSKKLFIGIGRLSEHFQSGAGPGVGYEVIGLAGVQNKSVM